MLLRRVATPAKAVARLVNGPARTLAGRRIAGGRARVGSSLKVLASMTAPSKAPSASGTDTVTDSLLKVQSGVVQLYR